MTDKRNEPLDFPSDPGDADDVEILEVVALDDGHSPIESGDGDFVSDDDEVGDGSDEMVLALDGDDPDYATDPLATGAGVAFSAPSAIDPSYRKESRRQARESRSETGETELSTRLRADYDNLRKRIDRERRDYQRRATSGLIVKLLPILDNFERALAAGQQPGSGEALHEGVQLIYRQLHEVLRKEGLRSIKAVGERFDPNLHEAVATDDKSTEPNHTVVGELQRGYLLREQVLRPAMVKVSTNDADSSEGDS